MEEEWISELELTCATYPHMHKKLCKLKFDVQKVNYLQKTLMESRDGTREGFDVDCTSEMLKFINKRRDNEEHKGFTFG